MVTNPAEIAPLFLDRGADVVTFHYEAEVHAHRLVHLIKESGAKAGISLCPGTPVSVLEDLIEDLDLVLIMTVNPGFGGQAFLPETMDKVRELVALRKEKGLKFEIEVDGGIDDKTIAQAKEAGATVFVAGSYVFKGDVNERVQTLRKQLD